jgi:hypothetical protein
VYLYLFAASAIRGGRRLFNATPRMLYPGQRDLAHIAREVGWASEPLWTVAETKKLMHNNLFCKKQCVKSNYGTNVTTY